MDSNNYAGPPAKRQRLGEPPTGPPLGFLPMQSAHPIQSVQSIPAGYLPSPSTQQGTMHSTPHFLPMTGYYNNFDPRFSGFGGQWMGGPRPLLRAECMLPNGRYPQPIPNVHYQGYGQLQLAYSDRSNVMMQPQPSMYTSPGLPYGTGRFPCPSPQTYPQSYHQHASTSLPNHENFQTSLETPDQVMPEVDPHGMDDHPTMSAQLEESEDVEIETVCFGVIPDISASYELRGASDIPSKSPVQINSSDKFSSLDGMQIDGRIPPEYGEMIQGLIDEPTVTLHVSCMFNKPAAKKTSRKFDLLHCVLEITVYGSLEILEEIGDWFQGHGIYLQDPRSCHMEVRYCNPQRLSAYDLDTCPLLHTVVSSGPVSELQDIGERHDPLDILSGHLGLEETPQPSIINTILKRHQKQALTFMLHREKGWGFNDDQPDIWEKVDTRKGRAFINTISEVYQAEEPPQFQGGIIADPMGLGKTLTMVALVATDLDTDIGTGTIGDSVDYDKSYASATLIIVPPPLLGSWEEQLDDHVTIGALRCRRHHGQTKLANDNELDGVNIVLTTYQTVSAEWKSEKLAGNSVLFQVCWRRIILDEAHFIRNGKSRMARAICDLDSVARWAVSGTPIQNRIGDLVSLLKFIRVHPYDDPERFEADISQVWKSGKEQDAIKRLQRLSACLLLRRAKGTINLPPRRDFLLPIQLSHKERTVYNELRELAIVKIDEALHHNPGTSRTRGYVSVLQQIESLRLFCNLGLHYHSRHEKVSQPFEWSNVAQSTFNSESEMHAITCLKCSSTLDVSESILDDSTTRQAPLFFSCLRLVCAECLSENRATSREPTCGHRPSCPASTVSTGSIVLEEVSASTMSMAQLGPTFNSLPSKIEALVKDLQSVPPDVQCIIFSTWRLTLDLVEMGLNQASIRSIRFDGKVPQKNRQGIIDKFRTDPSIRVMLLTLSCGAVGLTLTTASRAYLMELSHPSDPQKGA